jgi:hypothetical protein
VKLLRHGRLSIRLLFVYLGRNWRTADNQVFLVPRIKFLNRVKGSLSNFDERRPDPHGPPIPQGPDAYLAAISFGYFFRSQICFGRHPSLQVQAAQACRESANSLVRGRASGLRQRHQVVRNVLAHFAPPGCCYDQERTEPTASPLASELPFL